jgi:translation initiation factor IF-2
MGIAKVHGTRKSSANTYISITVQQGTLERGSIANTYRGGVLVSGPSLVTKIKRWANDVEQVSDGFDCNIIAEGLEAATDDVIIFS